MYNFPYVIYQNMDKYYIGKLYSASANTDGIKMQNISESDNRVSEDRWPILPLPAPPPLSYGHESKIPFIYFVGVVKYGVKIFVLLSFKSLCNPVSS